LLPRFPRYNQSALQCHSNTRFLPVLLIGAAACLLGGCTAAFGPGYSIDKQEIRVHFVPTPDPNILIEADYNLRNSGNQPLDELEIRLPGRRRFHFSNARATWDGASLTIAESPDNDRNELLKLPQAWVISSVHKLHLSVELQSGDNGASGLSFAADAFFLPAQGWSPELVPSRGAFATGGIPPKKWNLQITVPTEFAVHASGKPPKKSGKGGETTLRAEQTVNDIYPFVIAGKYQATQIGGGKEKVNLWTRGSQEPGNLKQTSDAIVRTTKTYDEVFGSRAKQEGSLWIVECPVVAGCFSTQEGGNLPRRSETERIPARAELVSRDTLMVDLSGGTQNLAAAAGPSLAASWLGYGKNPGFYEQDPPLSALPSFAAAIGRDANGGTGARAESIRTVLRMIPQATEKGKKDGPGVVRAKSLLFFYALQDRYGAEVFRAAMSHMFYARQGHGFDLDDLISAFDEESPKNLAEFVRIWMKRPGVPEEFRARYESSAAAAAANFKEATP
jgi:hypothetical protein